MPAGKPLSLRESHRAHTRSRIQDAARKTFFGRGYHEATIDEIAQAAGVSRSTLYLYFPDKPDMLAHIAEAYGDALCKVVERLPSPNPSRAEIGVWVGELARFIAEDRTPAILITHLSERVDAPVAVSQIGERLIEALAARLPAFAAALNKGGVQDMARAWALVVMRDLGWACLQAARDDGKGLGASLLIVAGDLLEHFIKKNDEWKTA
jgi:AcrR family transcriptional regulator